MNSISKSAKYKVIGLMSGTSLDGLDLVCCEFTLKNKKWNFKLKASETLRYSSKWRAHLSSAQNLDGDAFELLDIDFGFFIGNACNQFIKKNQLKGVQFIASHGHTIFHQPKKKFTFQLGNGNAIHHVTGLPVVNDFRSLDVLKGGEGAPLVPIGDHLLFSQFDVCLNLGGIANLSRVENGKRVAFDICFANMGLNYLAEKMNKTYDKGGKEAAKGKVDAKMLNQLGSQYRKWKKMRPSLGREDFEKFIQPILNHDSISLQDRLRTIVESISLEISSSISSKSNIKLLATGGGAMNSFLMRCIQEKLGKKVAIIVPDAATINYKEAIVFALLGVLRVRNEVNVLKSVTGAPTDSSAGVMIGF
ncbi:MAG: anhydro-N-acetylmuramic acid kinase [Cyclobacteriaceae bacterium]